MRIKILLLFFLLSIFSLKCSKEETPTQAINHAPKIESFSANPDTIFINEQTALACVATDEDGDNLTITYTSQVGTFPNGNAGVSVIWQAPTIAGNYSVTATVNDGKLTDDELLYVNVKTIPSAPTLFLPSNGATSVSLPPTLTWNASSGATNYTLQVSTNNSFTSFVYNQSGLTSTSQQVTGLNNSLKYYWRVSATNTFGTSGWSSVWNFTEIEACPGTITYEGKTYNTLQIGDQCWLKENLDAGTRIDGVAEQTDNGVIEKYCYDNDPANCTTYGGLYQWNEAMQYVTNEAAKGICPSGWHVPTYAEFETLIAAVNNDGNALKEIGQGTGGGAGTNTSGFSALLAGFRYFNGGFGSLGDYSFFWSSSGYNATDAYRLFLYFSDSDIVLYHYSTVYGFSVRCIKD